ncbi:MAG: YidC/Oxa1 family membrane protein insertase [Bacillota bacterium]
MGFLADVMMEGVEWLYRVSGSYGLAIILFTVLLRLVLMPLSVSQTRSMQKQQELQPIIAELQKKYKNDPKRLNEEMAALFRENRVNPLSSCLMLLIQIPFLIAFLQALERYAPLKEATFLWMSLGKPDPYILPILAGATTYLQFKVSATGTDSSQKTMLYVFPVLIWWMATRFAAALSLYWVVSNLWSIGERFVLPKPQVKKGEAKRQ